MDFAALLPVEVHETVVSPVTLTWPVAGVVDPSSDTLYVVDARAAEVLKIAPDGEVAGRWGRQGDGPGEFQRPEALGLLGDAVWVSDGALRRVTWFDRVGAVLETHALPSQPLDGFVFHIAGGLPLSRTRFLGTPRATAPETVAPVAQWPLVLLDHEGKVLDVRPLALGAPTMVAMERTDGSIWPGYGRPYFSVTPLVGVLPGLDTSLGVVVERRPTDEGTYRVTWLDDEGRTVDVTDVSYEPVPITLGVDSLRAAVERWARDQPEPQLVTPEARVAAQYLPDHVPAVSELVATATGVWLRRESMVNSGRWDFIPRPGSGLDRMAIVMDPEVRLLAGSPRGFWGIRTGEYDEPILVRLEPEGRP